MIQPPPLDPAGLGGEVEKRDGCVSERAEQPCHNQLQINYELSLACC